MVTGRLPARPQDAIGSAWRSLAAVLLLAVLGFWGWQWQHAPVAAVAGMKDAVATEGRPHGDDD
jgi:hypothetical protein